MANQRCLLATGSKVLLHNIGCLAERDGEKKKAVEDLEGRLALCGNLSGVKKWSGV